MKYGVKFVRMFVFGEKDINYIKYILGVDSISW